MEELVDNFILKSRLRPLADAREYKEWDKMVAKKEVKASFAGRQDFIGRGSETR